MSIYKSQYSHVGPGPWLVVVWSSRRCVSVDDVGSSCCIFLHANILHGQTEGYLFSQTDGPGSWLGKDCLNCTFYYVLKVLYKYLSTFKYMYLYVGVKRAMKSRKIMNRIVQ